MRQWSPETYTRRTQQSPLPLHSLELPGAMWRELLEEVWEVFAAWPQKAGGEQVYDQSGEKSLADDYEYVSGAEGDRTAGRRTCSTHML